MNKKCQSIILVFIFGFIPYIKGMNEFCSPRITRSMTQHISEIKKRIQNGEDPNFIHVTKDKLPAMIFAIKIGDSSLLQEILNNGDPNHQVQNPGLFRIFHIPIQYSLKVNNFDAARILARHPRINKKRLLYSISKFSQNHNAVQLRKLMTDIFQMDCWKIIKDQNVLHTAGYLALNYKIDFFLKRLIAYNDFDLEYVIRRPERNNPRLVTFLSKAVEMMSRWEDSFEIVKMVLFKKFQENSLNNSNFLPVTSQHCYIQIPKESDIYCLLKSPKKYIRKNYHEFETVSEELGQFKRSELTINGKSIYTQLISREHNITLPHFKNKNGLRKRKHCFNENSSNKKIKK